MARAHERIDAGDLATAAGLLEQLDRPGAGLEVVVNIDLARCHIATVSDEHRALFGPALARIAERTDVPHDPTLAPRWHFYRVTGDLLTHGTAVAEHVREFAEAVARLGVEAENAQLLVQLLANLRVHGREDLAGPLHRWARRLDVPGDTDWDTWHELAYVLRTTGAGAEAERICTAILAAGPARTRVGAGITLSVHLAGEDRHDEAYALLTEALETADREGWRDLADAARNNLMATHLVAGRTEHLESDVRAWLADIAARRAEPPAVAVGLRTVRALRAAGRDLLALDVLTLYTDRDWSAESDAEQLAWLEAIVDVFQVLSDDAAAADLSVRAIGIDERLSRSAVARFGPDDYDRIGRAYDLLVTFHSDLERLDATTEARALFYTEAAKEAAFSRALPGMANGPLRDEAAQEARGLVMELARLETAAEVRLQGDLAAVTDLPGGSTRATSRIRITPAYANEQVRERRGTVIRERLRHLRQAPAGGAGKRVGSFLGPEPRDLAQAPWPEGTVGLAQRLDRAESELVTYLVGAHGFAHRSAVDVNPAVLDALLTVLSQTPEDEIDHITGRLADLLLPGAVRDGLDAHGADTLVISGDTTAQTVPWEALGTGDDRLGLRFSLCRTPSLLRGVAQLSTPANPAVERALVVADPTGDLPAAAAEGAMLHHLLTARGVATTVLPACTRGEFLAELPHHTLVHFAGHTNYLRTDPASSHFLLADGPLTADELARVPVHPDSLFVLGSCESAQSGQEPGFGNSFGIGTVLLLQGAASVIGGNWSAGDARSLAQSECLYAHLLAGRTVSEALRAARRDLHGRGEPTSSWALLTVMGDPFARLRTVRAHTLS
ncbi:CHAT domain-containing protein [Streptomyces liangshanensis]|uniref:CHAT domain-containing protein n=1 Tax=Streptomyces liangshanensis TaxID=2717324 RepID=A0A6G9H4W3_9ACTN|nr:CHAT domain-containing protein [Streptomyces liangshanensis]QIQ05578.1 CHAT domain-containing protein [Streptomyces liangshanensis]